MIISFDKINRKSGRIELLHWETFLKRLWQDEIGWL